MKSAQAMLDGEQRARVRDAVTAAEKRTAAEIVPVIATESGRYDRAEDLVGFLTALGAFVLTWLFFQRNDPTAGGWDGLEITLQLPVLVLVLILGFMIGTLLATQIAWLRRLFTPAMQMQEEVDAAAGQLFSDRRVHHTEAATGVLIYISLFERRAVILADGAVYDKLGQAGIDRHRDALIASLRNNSVGDAMVEAINKLGNELAEALPATETNRNEIGDSLVLID